MNAQIIAGETEVLIPIGETTLSGVLETPGRLRGMVLFAQVDVASRARRQNELMARVLHDAATEHCWSIC